MIVHSHARGFGLLEIVVSTAILALVLLGISSFFQSALRLSASTTQLYQANMLLEEGIESVKMLRDTSFSNNIATLSTTTPYYLSWNGSSWALGTTPVIALGAFTRTITVGDVMRGTNDDIAQSGTHDPNTKLITATVSWVGPNGVSTKSISTYLANLFSN